MKLEFLGDALDHWKGSIFKCLKKERILRGFAIDPMFSDRSKWTKENIDVYANILQIKKGQIIQHSRGLRNRHEYFSEIIHSGDLFLDPDTGVAAGKTCTKKHVKPQEIAGLIRGHRSRLLVLYQHNTRGKISEHIDNVLSAINAKLGSFAWCSYESSSCAVAMLFLSGQDSRVNEVKETFIKLLGSGSKLRIRTGKFRPNK